MQNGRLRTHKEGKHGIRAKFEGIASHDHLQVISIPSKFFFSLALLVQLCHSTNIHEVFATNYLSLGSPALTLPTPAT
jgi:hypothetical protein